MSGFIQASIDAEDITEAMNEDGGFALDVWREIAQKLHMGRLLDEACDLLSQVDPKEARFIAEQFRTFAMLIESRHEGDDQ